MRVLFILLLALFVAPLGIDLASRDLVSRSNQSPSAPKVAVRVDDEPSRVNAAPEMPAPASSQSAAASVAADSLSAAPATVPTTTTSSARLEPSPIESAPGSNPVPDADVASQVESEVLRLTNEERATHGLPSLEENEKLGAIARVHSADMLTHGYFSHDDQEGCGSSCRATEGGYRWRAIGENIYMMSGYHLTPQKAAAKVVEGWMDSPGHRANILSTSFAESGVGVVYDGTSMYVTTMYGKRR